jgi:phosphatidylglycerophosphate synthase
MSDKLTIYPVVKQSDWVYTIYKVRPNTITLCNNLCITPLMYYHLYYDEYVFALCWVWIRAYLDSLDGYIARKFDQCSDIGEIYDHFSDCLYAGTLTTLLMNKLVYLPPYAASLGYIASIGCVVCDYDKQYHWIAKLAGAGGNEDGYSFLLPFVSVVCMGCLYYAGLTV